MEEINEATPLSSPAPTSPSMMQERERRRANVPTISSDATIIAIPTQCTSFLLGLVLVVGASSTCVASCFLYERRDFITLVGGLTNTPMAPSTRSVRTEPPPRTSRP
jgi:hypothetical protein